jgi:hypothetical protein
LIFRGISDKRKNSSIFSKENGKKKAHSTRKAGRDVKFSGKKFLP